MSAAIFVLAAVAFLIGSANALAGCCPPLDIYEMSTRARVINALAAVVGLAAFVGVLSA